MTKLTKGQGLVGWIVIVAIVALVIILAFNPQLTLIGAMTVLWNKMVASWIWLVEGVKSGYLLAIAIVVLIAVGLISLLRRH